MIAKKIRRAINALCRILGSGISEDDPRFLNTLGDRTVTYTLDQIDGDQIEIVQPCFVLSTGRCGTKWLTELLRKSSQVFVNHSMYPQLIRHGRLAYEQYSDKPEVFRHVVRAARDRVILKTYSRGLRYIETNNRITFLAYAIKDVYPNASFIHLYRHPGDFVRSGLRRKWYEELLPHEVGRIVDVESPEKWATMGTLERIAWLWNETNRYIDTFLDTLPTSDYIQVRAEDMWNDEWVVMNTLDFLQVSDISLRAVRRMLQRQVNAQRKGGVSPFSDWPREQKCLLAEYAWLSQQYGYNLEEGG